MRYPSCLLLRICRNARQASLEMAGDADGFIRFHAERISVSGKSREEYKVSRDSTLENAS
jgi:hypothetical protein